MVGGLERRGPARSGCHSWLGCNRGRAPSSASLEAATEDEREPCALVLGLCLASIEA